MGAAARTLDRLLPTYQDNELALYRIGGNTAGAPAAHVRVTMMAHSAWLAMLVVGAAGAVLTGWFRARR